MELSLVDVILGGALVLGFGILLMQVLKRLPKDDDKK